uniref:Uncharacterized protein n=1 Tax=Moniliophthora roreri TaxID=221103 RepID=A0A0W0G2S8_MONRR
MAITRNLATPCCTLLLLLSAPLSAPSLSSKFCKTVCQCQLPELHDSIVTIVPTAINVL